MFNVIWNIENWSSRRRKFVVIAVFFGLCFLEYLFVLRVSWQQLIIKQQVAQEMAHYFSAGTTAFSKRGTRVSKKISSFNLEKIQMANLHHPINLSTLFFYLLDTAHKNSVQVLLLKPLLQSPNMQIQLVLQGSYFQLINDLLQLQDAPWSLRILKLKIVANHLQEQFDLVIEVCH